ncbi:MAG: UDP-N-acetylmuramate dehydrogenase [Acidobacteriota bacterium]
MPPPDLASLLAPFEPLQDEPLAPWTTFRIGGPADWFVTPTSGDQLAKVVSLARRHEIPYFLLGTGANILVGDGGFRGLVIHNGARQMGIDGHRVWAESGARVYPDLIELAVGAGLSGLEHYVGIPSSVGGALWQNLHFLAPPPKRERTMFIEEVLSEAEILDQEGQRRRVGVEYFDFGYDYSILHIRQDIVLRATFDLEPKIEAEMRAVMAANLAWRGERHPPLDTEPSAGSIFKKIEGIGAGRLIDEAGLKGLTVGGAEISPRHANIIVNRGGATARDVRILIQRVQQTVHEQTGRRLEPEISFIGEFAEPPML